MTRSYGRRLSVRLLADAGHFTLRDEPYLKRPFDFPIVNRP